MNTKVQESLKRIQDEARRIVAERLATTGKPFVATDVAKSAAQASPESLIRSLKEQTKLTNISNTAAAEFAGEFNSQIQNFISEAVQEVTSGHSINTPFVVLPNNCKYIHLNDDGSGVVLIEEPPQLRTVNARIAGQRGTYRIPLPYMVFLIGFRPNGKNYIRTNLGVGFLKKPLSSLSDMLYFTHLPHTGYGNNYVCQPSDFETADSIKKLAENVVFTFWNTAFHHSMTPFKISNKKIKNLDMWSNIKPLDILKSEFNSGTNVSGVLKTFSQNASSYYGSPLKTKLQKVLQRRAKTLTGLFSAEEIAKTIQDSAEKIIDSAIQNSGLQSENPVV